VGGAQISWLQLANRGNAQQSHCVQCLFVHNLQRALRTGGATGAHAIEDSAAGQHRVGPESQRLEQVGAATQPARVKVVAA
jgi:hypothetical protein